MLNKLREIIRLLETSRNDDNDRVQTALELLESLEKEVTSNEAS